MNATIITLEDESYPNDLLIEIDYKDKNETNIRLVLNLNDQVIAGVQKAIKAWCKNNRRIDVLPLNNVIPHNMA